MNLVRFLVLLLFVTSAQSKDFEGLFGFKLNDSLLNYVSIDHIQDPTNRVRHNETNTGKYFDMFIPGEQFKKNPLLTTYYVTFDHKRNTIEQVIAYRTVENEAICSALKNAFRDEMESEFDLLFENITKQIPMANIVSDRALTKDEGRLEIQCAVHKRGNWVNLQVIASTKQIYDDIRAYYHNNP